MAKIAIIAALLVVAAAFATENLWGSGNEIDVEQNGPKIVSKHLQAQMDGSPTFTTDELKQFSGQAIQLLKNKCPALPKMNVAIISNSLSQHVAFVNDEKNISPLASKLINDVYDCANGGEESSTTTTTSADADTSFSSFWLWDLLAGETQNTTETAPTTTTTTESTTYDQYDEYVTVQDTDESAEQGDEDKVASSEPEILDLWDWLDGILNGMIEFFYSFELPESVTKIFLRKKRSASSSQESVEVYGPVSIEDITPPVVPLTGSTTFVKLIDAICTLYCKKCSHGYDMMNFKAAAKQLLELIEKDNSENMVIAETYIDDSFMNALNDCLNNIK